MAGPAPIVVRLRRNQTQMTRTKRLRILNEIYAQIPSPNCKGLCWRACTGVPVFPIERAQLEATGRKISGERFVSVRADNETVVLTGPQEEPCPFLVERRCSAYDVRPMICRVFGAAEGLPCPFGCTPPLGPISDAIVHKLLQRLEELD